MQQNTPKRILIVDDEPDILEFLQVILEEEGYAVITSDECVSYHALRRW